MKCQCKRTLECSMFLSECVCGNVEGEFWCLCVKNREQVCIFHDEIRQVRCPAVCHHCSR